jgi:Hemerythrin HHE cation binding domain
VLEQHGVLRGLLQRALDQTTRELLHEEGTGLGELTETAQELARCFHGHLAFEERRLAPILAVMDLWGPERVADLLSEHARQRAEMEALLEGIAQGWDADRVALTLRSLTADLLSDMAEEERGCLHAEILRWDVVEVDQHRT